MAVRIHVSPSPTDGSHSSGWRAGYAGFRRWSTNGDREDGSTVEGQMGEGIHQEIARVGRGAGTIRAFLRVDNQCS